MSGSPREAMLDSTIVLLRERGLTGTSVRDVVAHSGAPRGSVYHHFPGGKAQMVDEAIDRAGGAISSAIGYFEQEGDPVAALDGLVDFFIKLLEASDFNAGCPIAAVAGEADTSEGRAQAAAAGRAFDEWRGKIAAAGEHEGIAPDRARSLATLTIASLEGALLMCRAARNTAPLEDVANELRPLIESELA